VVTSQPSQRNGLRPPRIDTAVNNNATTNPRDLADDARSRQIVDIRKKPDDRQIPGSVRLDPVQLEEGTNVPFAREDEIVLYCGSGNSCARIASVLRERGYNATALEGGYKGWLEAGLPTEPRD
jgi:rhodanese-related sulfurtransferase